MIHSVHIIFFNTEHDYTKLVVLLRLLPIPISSFVITDIIHVKVLYREYIRHLDFFSQKFLRHVDVRI